MLKTTAVADRRYLDHLAGHHHPESPARMTAVLEALAQLKRPGLDVVAARTATVDEIRFCHRPDYVELMASTAGYERYDFDPDTHASKSTFTTAMLAAGGVLTAVEAVLSGAADNAFALVRPPGHHALADRAMGFCFFNNVAVAAACLIARGGLSRVLILDWDVHHGNGTQDIFYASNQVLYTSLHQYPFYPGTGGWNEIGTNEGRGYTVNFPLPASLGDPEYLAGFDSILMPIARRFKPQFVLVSAGFDAHHRDPLANMQVTEDGFVAMARRVKRLAAECCGGKLVLALEGGYDLPALASSIKAVLEELGRDADEPIAGQTDTGRAAPILARARAQFEPFWALE